MRLNLPILEQLSGFDRILIAGAGGGFDIFCGLPLYFELRELGKTVHLANFSFSFLDSAPDAVQLSDTLVGVNANLGKGYGYFPELYLSQWFRETRQEEVTIWCFDKTGVRPLLESYQALVNHLNIQAILLIDGGVDSLLHGDESALGTIVEDSVSICAVNELKNVAYKLLVCVGFGIELDMSYAHVLENMAVLVKSDSFLGSCSLVKRMESYEQYEQALMYVHSVRHQDPSVINASLVSAVRGEFGNYHLTDKTRGSLLWISPLMPIYWFFDFNAVASQNLLLSAIRDTDRFADAMLAAWSFLATRRVRKAARIPLP